ncbi:lipopolysaccharide kinase InaA family protein [Aliiroseovarius sp. S253]|uniref:lipopolysaccharide kinase InaA family protein n=1 Tax=Aliiroseovarius sp. S253 TaxID=3415133 RepID=UPI003C7C68DB
MSIHERQFADPALQAQLDQFLSDQGARIARLEHKGRCYWAKKGETLSLRWRIQKGDPMEAFRADVAGHHALADAGVPVPEIVAEGEDFIVTEDSGPTLSTLLVEQKADQETRLQAFHAAGVELAGMHSKGLSHGRPAIKDMCWDGQTISFLDFERFSPSRNTARGHMHDLIIFIHSIYGFVPKDIPEAEAAAEGYRSNDTTGTWDRAATWCRKMRWLDPVTKPLQWGNRVGAMEFKAIPLTLKTFGVR